MKHSESLSIPFPLLNGDGYEVWHAFSILGSATNRIVGETDVASNGAAATLSKRFFGPAINAGSGLPKRHNDHIRGPRLHFRRQHIISFFLMIKCLRMRGAAFDAMRCDADADARSPLATARRNG